MIYNKTFPDEPERKRTVDSYKTPSCKFCEGVHCSPYDSKGRRTDRNCEKCGHNPEVARKRTEEFCQKHGITIPKVK